jgi:hypothetical protein
VFRRKREKEGTAKPVCSPLFLRNRSFLKMFQYNGIAVKNSRNDDGAEHGSQKEAFCQRTVEKGQHQCTRVEKENQNDGSQSQKAFMFHDRRHLVPCLILYEIYHITKKAALQVLAEL